MKKITILTSRQNFTWVSMEEIITWIEKSWENWSKKNGITCHVINTEIDTLSKFAKDAINSDLIIVTCFNVPIANYLRALRGEIGISTPWIYYLHGLASYGSWPLFHWKIGQLLNNRDQFVGSCSRDFDQFNIIFKNINCKIIPFSFDQLKDIPTKTQGEKLKLIYVGRISSQKNLHTLILALSELKKVHHFINWEMHFFGKPDNYGSPLIGKQEEGYEELLKKLIDTLDLSKEIIFHGFRLRDEIDQYIGHEKWTFISPSIHSDENFGMAAFRCLINGHRAILSDWGGHTDFKKYFKDQVSLVSVNASSIGPFIQISDLVHSILREGNRTCTFRSWPVPEYYSQLQIEKSYSEIWTETQSHEIILPISVSETLENILSRREKYLGQSYDGGGSQIFEDYRDPLLQIFYSAYGQKGTQTKAEGFKRVPWLNESAENFHIDDPHRGRFILPKKNYDQQHLISFGLIY